MRRKLEKGISFQATHPAHPQLKNAAWGQSPLAQTGSHSFSLP